MINTEILCENLRSATRQRWNSHLGHKGFAFLANFLPTGDLLLLQTQHFPYEQLCREMLPSSVLVNTHRLSTFMQL